MFLLPACLLVACGGERGGAPPQVIGAGGNAVDEPSLTAAPRVGPRDWPQWGGTPARNNAVPDAKVPTGWAFGQIDFKTNAWTGRGARHVKWVARLGSQTYGVPVVANRKVFIGTNNGAGHVARHPKDQDRSVLLCLSETDGTLLWQHTNEKLDSPDNYDWEEVGICSAPLVDGQRLWYVTNRCQVVCLDTEGFHDGQNDGPVTTEPRDAVDEADVVWRFDMFGRLGVRPHNMSNCSPTAAGDYLFVNTSNGTDERDRVTAPGAPSFICLDRRTGRLIWSNALPGPFIMHGQWSSPAFGRVGDKDVTVFAGGDGHLYGFAPHGHKGLEAQPLWSFDCNPKDAVWRPHGAGTRNNIIATPVINEGRVYVAVGQDPEHGDGDGAVWCIEPAGDGDVSPTQAFASTDASDPLPRRRTQAMNRTAGEVERPNPNSAVVWSYTGGDVNGDGSIDFEEQMHRATGTVAIHDGLLFIADLSGVLHCLDAASGEAHWTHDLMAPVWASPLITAEWMYVCDTDGGVTVFATSANKRPQGTVSVDEPIHSTPVVANNVLYIATLQHLFAIAGP